MNKKLAAMLVCMIQLNTAFAAPRLIVQIVVDQLRGDLLQKYQNQFGAQGFNYLVNYGINYQSAHHPHANTVTCAGHTTISTGTYPAMHGIVGNYWYSRNANKDVYCMDDANVQILPTIHTHKSLTGRSPRNIMASTFSDELVLAQKGRSFGVSLKDRGAITMAGHAGKAFWFDKENGGFVSSNYYYQQYPQWVNDWNGKYQPKEQTWNLSKPLESYQFAHAPTNAHRFKHYGQGFPHYSGQVSNADYYQMIAMMPIADELTADFAIHLMTQEKLGKDLNKTDYLSVSFSAVDKIGHQFGPNSLESEDNLIRLDATLAKFFSAIDQQVGLQNTLIVLSADHGVSDSLIYLKSHNMPVNRTLNQHKMETTLRAQLANQFQLPATVLKQVSSPFIYLDHDLITQQRLSVSTVAKALAETLNHQTGIFRAYALPMQGQNDWLSDKVAKMAYLRRSGDIYLVYPPYQKQPLQDRNRVSHGTPWVYDSYVPLIFANPGFKAKRIYRSVLTTDIAATLSAIEGIKAPSASVGTPLHEVIQRIG